MDPASWAQRLAEAADVDTLGREGGDGVDMEAAAAAEKERVRRKQRLCTLLHNTVDSCFGFMLPVACEMNA